MKKMFLKKIICLFLLLTLFLQPMQRNHVFSFDLENDIFSIKEDEKWSEFGSASLNEYEDDNQIFIRLWNELVDKYIFDKCSYGKVSFKESKLYLSKETELSVEMAYILYSLAAKLQKHESLCDGEDIEKIARAKDISENYLYVNEYLPRDIFERDFQGGTWNLFINVSVANTIYKNILKFLESKRETYCSSSESNFVNVSSYSILLDEGNITDCFGKAMCMDFEDLWIMILNCFVFEKIDTIINKTSCNRILNIDLCHLNVENVRLLHEFSVKLKACDNLYSKEVALPYIAAAIKLTEKIARKKNFDLPDNAINEFSNSTWEENQEMLMNFYKRLKFFI